MLHCDQFQIPFTRLDNSGFLKIWAPIARAGDLRYYNRDGSTRIERVSRDTLQRSAHTFREKPISLYHPRDPITADNAAQHFKGFLGSAAHIDENGLLWMSGTITHKDAIDAVLAGERELSCGYAVPELRRIDEGLFEQADRIGNHVAIVPRGRAGAEVSIRVDADEPSFELWTYHCDDVIAIPEWVRNDLGTVQQKIVIPLSAMTTEATPTKVYALKLDGLDFETADQNLVKHTDSVNQKLASLQQRIDALESEKAALEGTVAGLKTENDELKSNRVDADAIAAIVSQRLDAISKVLPWMQSQDADFKAETLIQMDAADIQRTYLEKRTGLKLDGKSAEYLAGMFASLPPDATPARQDHVSSLFGDIDKSRADGATVSNVDGMKAKRDERIKKNGLGASLKKY